MGLMDQYGWEYVGVAGWWLSLEPFEQAAWAAAIGMTLAVLLGVSVPMAVLYLQNRAAQKATDAQAAILEARIRVPVINAIARIAALREFGYEPLNSNLDQLSDWRKMMLVDGAEALLGELPHLHFLGATRASVLTSFITSLVEYNQQIASYLDALLIAKDWRGVASSYQTVDRWLNEIARLAPLADKALRD